MDVYVRDQGSDDSAKTNKIVRKTLETCCLLTPKVPATRSVRRIELHLWPRNQSVTLYDWHHLPPYLGIAKLSLSLKPFIIGWTIRIEGAAPFTQLSQPKPREPLCKH